MRKSLALMIAPAIACTMLAVAPAATQRVRDSREVFEATRSGRLLPLREIERRVLPGMSGCQYLGVEFDSATGIYTLKFLRNGNVIWIEVDGQSGAVIHRSGF